LNEGDLIVHHEHGIGKYIGLKNIPLYLNIHECVEIEYYNKDKLFIPVENLDLISRYGDKDNPVSLDKLGSSNWQLRKSVIKDKIKIIAHDLIQIAAERALKKGRIMVPDFDLYENFSSKFEYAETSDQIKAINDVEDDLSSGKPMDRLICGDVGFGKTEISMRAAFIAAMNDYQVIFLCPTTLLANQHYKSFISRFENFNINIKKITRFESRSEKTSIYENIENNSIKIIIGTHALFNHSINFNNLGLLIVDEEQSFGVEQKEKLKKIKSDIHVLTLTATPIPRTLQSSLLGIRDLSIIKTPPIDRLPIKTFLTIFNKTTIRNAILNEIERGGQVFYVSPKIKDLNRIKEKLSKILPKVSCEIVHGRLSGEQLNDIYSSFFENKIKILISTSIIESGLDVSNANTIIIEKPNYFGLSQIYQLRGRVGRSDVQSYAYLVLSDNQILSTEANKRLNVIANLDTLGGGFSLASHDMNIRGTGNLIGSEQSGHVREVGIELYQKLVKDAINETKSQSSVSNDWSPQINIGFSVYIPKEYIPDLQMRLNIYRRISFINSVSKIKEILLELKDRFGNVPEELINLTKLIEIKNLCRISNINKVDMGSKGFTISFRNNRFNNIQKLLNLVSKNSNLLKIRPDNKLLYLKKWTNIDDKINDIIKFLTILSKMQNEKKISNNHQD
ncbi:MAG: transcription-repair coupling factor, partial [Rickettsiales bacterium]